MTKYISYTVSLLEALAVLDAGSRLSLKWFRRLIHAILTVSLLSTGIAELVVMSDDFSHFNDILSPVLIGIVGLTKYICLIYDRKQTMYLIKKITDDTINEDKSESDDLVIQYYDRTGHILAKIISWAIFGAVIALCLQNMPDLIFQHDLHTPLDFHTIWTLDSTVTFVIVYTQQVSAILLHGLTFITTNTCSIFLTYHACGHLTVLQNYLERIADDENWVAYKPMDLSQRIAKCVRLHQNVCKLIEEIDDLFTVPNLVHFLFSAVGLCTDVYELSGEVDVEMVVKHVSSIAGQFTQLFIVNWCGQLIQDKSLGVSLAVYRAKFYKLEPHHQRDITMILVRAQRPMYLTAGKFYTLSFESIAMTLKAAMSCFAVFANAGEQQEN